MLKPPSNNPLPEVFNLLDLANAIVTEETRRRHSILMYGDSRTGKTRLAGTLAKVPEITQINWFDGENGSDTLVTMLKTGILTQEQARKFKIFKVLDTPENPYLMETMTKVLCVRGKHSICLPHGRVACPTCLKISEVKWQEYQLHDQPHSHWNVLDSGSQLANSVMAWLCKGKEFGFKPGWDEYGPQGRMLSDMLSVVQAGVANWLFITHTMILDDKFIEKKLLDEKRADSEFSKIYPLMGSKNFCLNVAKYFGSTIYLEKKLGKHMGGSTSTYRSDVLTGSRIGMNIEAEKELDLSLVFPKLGIYGGTEQVLSLVFPKTEKK